MYNTHVIDGSSLIYKNLPFGIFVLKMTTMISFEYFVGNEINS